MTRRRWLFVLVLFGVLVAALLPNDRAPDLGDGDKVNHIAAFVTLSFVAAWAWPTTRLRAIGVALSAFGGAIEGLQAIPFIARDAEWGDWIADTAAVAVALTIVAIYRRVGRATSSGR